MEPENYIIRVKNPKCLVCLEKYNTLDIVPLIFRHTCGHSICESCYYQLVETKCPKCRSTYDRISFNTELTDKLKEIHKGLNIKIKYTYDIKDIMSRV